MKRLSIILAAFLVVGMLLGISSVAYADDPPPPDVVVYIDITGENPEVWINGQNLSEPTAVYNYLGVDGGWVTQKLNEALAPLQSWINEYGSKLDLTTEGLAKLILLVQQHNSEIGTLSESLDSQGKVASLSEDRMSTLESQQAQTQARITALEDSYNRKLIILSGVFLVVVLGLAMSLLLLWRRTHIAR